MRESARWLDVSFSVKAADLSNIRPIKGSIPLLRSLTLTDPADSLPIRSQHDPMAVPQDCRRIFKGTPRLTRVRLTDLSTWQFDWASLTALELTAPLPNRYFLQVLPHMQNLEKLLVHGPRGDCTVGASKTITLPRLRILSLFGFRLLSTLNAPALTQLSIDFSEFWSGVEDIPAALAKFLQISSCKVEHLCLGNLHWAEILAQVLPLTPEVKHLSIDATNYYCCIDSYILLTHSPDQPPLVPNLQSLTTAFCGLLAAELSALTAMISSRSGERMKELVFASPIMSDLNRAELKEVELYCKECGIQFKVIERVNWDSELGHVTSE
jgi:hypothetical protein